VNLEPETMCANNNKEAEVLEHIVELAQLKHPVVEITNWPDEVKALP